MKKFSLVAVAILFPILFSHSSQAEILLFSLQNENFYDVSPLNNSNIDESVLLIKLSSSEFESDFWNYEGDDISLDFLDKYNFELSHNYLSTSWIDENNYYVHNNIYYHDNYIENIRNNLRVSILFDNNYSIDVSPVLDFTYVSYSVWNDSYMDIDGKTATVINHHVYNVLPGEIYYRYGLNESLDAFRGSEYFISNGFGSATVNVNESSGFAITEGFWSTSYTPNHNNEVPISTPEPGTALLLGLGVLGLAGVGRLRRK